jgi:CDP-paratose 2-epimerase
MRAHYPSWDISISLRETIDEIVQAWGARMQKP